MAPARRFLLPVGAIYPGSRSSALIRREWLAVGPLFLLNMEANMSKFDREQPPKLITSRRAVAAGFMSIIATPAMGYGRDEFARKLQQLTEVPLSLSPTDFTDMMTDGLFLPDYRHPMVRVGFENGTTTNWHRYPQNYFSKTRGNAVFIETCVPDANGAPRFAQLKIG